MGPSKPEAPGLVFVGGAPRSGTSLVQKMLDLHPLVYGGPELGILPPLMGTYKQLSAGIRDGNLDMVLDQERARRAYRQFVLSLYEDRLARGDYRYLSERTPLNVLVFDVLADVFPDARFVWVIRDPRDVICSLRGVQKRSSRQDASVSMGRSIYADLRLMRRYLEAGEAFQRSCAERLAVVYYEDVLADPRAAGQRLCAFLGIGFDEQMLATERSNDTSAALGRKRKTPSVFYDLTMFDRPIDAANAGKWKTGLDARSLHAIQAHLGTDPLPCLVRYGIGAPGRAWSAFFAVWEPAANVSRAAASRVRRKLPRP